MNSDTQSNGRFQIIKPLGKGAFGEVCLALDNETGDICAVKTLLNSSRSNHDAEQEAFKNESRLWLAIGAHPHIVSALSVQDLNNKLTLALEYIPPSDDGAVTLRDILNIRAIPPAMALRYAIQICEGLQYAQTQGLRAHRDIKPENILISPSNHAKVSDFGLANFSSTRWRHLNLKQTSIGGTLLYMAPEQFTRSDVDHRADIYAIGIITYQLLTGKYPYNLAQLHGAADHQQFFEIRRKATPTPIQAPEWPLINQCLMADPDNRPQTYTGLIDKLSKLFLARAGHEYQSIPKSQWGSDKLITKAAAFVVLGELDIALSILNQAESLTPGAPTISNNRAAIMAQKGDVRSAVKIWQAIITRHPETARAHYNLGNYYFHAKSFEQAVECYNRCIHYEPTYVPAIANKAIALENLGKTEPAIDAYEEAIRVAPGDAKNYYNYGGFILKFGLFDEAKQYFLTCIRLNPQYVEAYNCLGHCDAWLKQYKSARAWHEKALAINPNDLWALEKLSKLPK